MPSYNRRGPLPWSQPSAPLRSRDPNASMASAPAEKRKRATTIDLTGDSDEEDFDTPQQPLPKAPKVQHASYRPLPTPPSSSYPSPSQSYRHSGPTPADRQHSVDERRAWLSQPSATQEIDDVDEIIDSSQDGATDTLTHYGDLPTKIVGVQYYRGMANPGEFILMRREPGNPYDSNAIRIDNVGYAQIGHIPRRIAMKLAPYLDEGLVKMDGRLAGCIGQFDCPLQIKIYGPDPRSAEGRSLVQRMTADKLPLKALKEAERLEKERIKQQIEANKQQAKAQQQAALQRLAEARMAAAAGASAARGGNGSFLPGAQGFRGEPAAGHGLSSQIDIFEAGQRFSPRDMGEVPEKFGFTEEHLKDMPKAPKPSGIKTEMLPYQLQALAWLLDRESPQLPTQQGPENAVQLWQKGFQGEYTNIATNFSTQTPPVLANGGILADDMGLGKTLEMISLMVADKEKAGRGPTLIVAPLSVMSNWSGQIATHVAEHSALQTYTYHGVGRVPMKPEDFAKYDVVITTYQTLTSDYMPKAKGSSNQQPKKELRASGLYSIQWRRVILDEGHIVRNPQAKGCLAVTALSARSRWVLSGTPIVNSLKDLYSLLRFIGITGGLEQLEAFNTCLVRPLKAGEPAATALLRAVMTAFSLRRKKEMAFIDLRLPKLEEFIHRIDFTKKERERYDTLLEQAQGMMRQYNTNANSADRAQAYIHLLTMLLRLRQCCNHWQLCGERVVDLFKQLEGNKTVELNAANIEALQAILQVQIESQDEDCPVCLESLHNPVITNCGHAFGRECIARVIETQHKCPMCRAELTDEACLVSPRHDGGDEEADDAMDLTQSSTKLERLVQILDCTRRAGQGEKTVVFSQYTRFLDIVQSRLDREGYTYCRLDGTMAPAKRDDALSALESDPQCTVMLASLGVCAVGLNLTAANQIILSDTWWSAAVEDQAVDRVHRLGQTRVCRVFRLVMDGSIEERTLEIQKEKRKLMMLAFAEKKSKRGDAKAGRLADIQRLLGGGEEKSG